MKTCIIPACALAAFVAAPFAAAGDEEAAVSEIRTLYAKIDEGKPLETTEIAFDVKEDPMEGTITRYTYPGGLLAIKLSYIAGDHGVADEHFYYRDSEPFFIFVKDQYWRFAEGGTPEKPAALEILTERRFYIRDGKCVRALRRSVEHADPEELPSLIAKEKNRKFEAADDVTRLLKRAMALCTVTDGEEAARFFAKEG